MREPMTGCFIPLLAVAGGGILLSLAFGPEGFVIGGLLGGLLGTFLHLLWRSFHLERRLTEVTHRLEVLEQRGVPAPEPVSEPSPEPSVEAVPPPLRVDPPVESAPPVVPSIPVEVAPPIETVAPIETAAPVEEPAIPKPPPAPPTPPAAPPPPRPRPVWDFLTGGNTLARLGLLILFLGFAFLVKYAADHDYFPLELRLAATAASGLALTAIGWRQRRRRREFGLSLQGGGVAVVYLTIFAAFRLYGLLPTGLAFGLLVATTVLCGLLALLQEAQVLSVLSLLGGFGAPVLTPVGDGDATTLLGYTAALNVGVLLLASYRPWRAVRLVGFFCTFGLLFWWLGSGVAGSLLNAVARPGGGDALPFATVEPFLIFFFLCYLAVGILGTRHRPIRTGDTADGTLVFGLPVVAFTLQALLVEPYEYGLAWSALGFGAVYAGVAAWLARRARSSARPVLAPGETRLLIEAFAGIALVLLTLVIPFALDATWTGTGWALEGAGLVWLGLRQGRRRVWAFGLLLQAVAGGSLLVGLEAWKQAGPPLLDRPFLGCLALAVAAWFTAWWMHRRRDVRGSELIERVFLVAGYGWWLLGGALEISAHVTSWPWVVVYAPVMLATGTAVASVWLRRRLDWAALRGAGIWLLPVLGVFLAVATGFDLSYLESGGWWVWPLAFAAHLWVLWRLDGEMGSIVDAALHAGSVWWLGWFLAGEGTRQVDRWTADGTVWAVLVTGLVASALALAVTRAATGPSPRWPFAGRRETYLDLGAGVPLLVAWGWSFFTFTNPAHATPLPYLPLLNPLDLTLAFALLTTVTWMRRRESLRRAVDPILPWATVGLAFLWANVTLARVLHHFFAVPWSLPALLQSNLFQVAVTSLWSGIAVSAMAWAARRAERTPWMVAAGLLGLTVVKLFLIDLSALGTVPRIVSFLVVGGLLLLVGYLAPVPPDEPDPPLGENPVP